MKSRTSLPQHFIAFCCMGVLLAPGLATLAQESVSITLGQSNTETGLFLKEPDGGATTVVTQGGSAARSTAPPAGKTGGFMYFAADPAFANNGSVDTLFVTVEYFDQGTDQFRLEYDAQPDPTNPNLDTDPFTIAQAGQALSKYDTKKWVTYQFRLANVYFGKRQPGAADFRINDMTLDADGNPVDGEAPEVIRKVVVSKTEPIPLHIKFTTTPVKVDGVLDDAAWATAQPFKVDSAIQDVIRPTKWTGTNDYALDARYAWDNTYLYFGYDVTDDADNNIVFGNRYNPSGADYNPREFIKFTPSKFEWHVNAVGQDVDYVDFPTNKWTHHVVVKKGNTLTYYRDGAALNTTNTITGAPKNAQPLYLGGQGTVERWKGLADEVAVFDRALSATEVQQVYTMGKAGQALAPQPLALASVSLSAANLTVTWTGGTPPFKVQARDNLSTGNWADVGSPTNDRTATVPRQGTTGFVRIVGQ